MEAIRSLRRQIRSEHGNSYAQISVVGVALDADPDAGLQFLLDLGDGTPSGAFDQISAGGSWLNEQAVRLFWRQQAAVAVIPQVIVIERRVDTGSYLSHAEIRVQDDTVVANPYGHEAILDWLEQGTPLHAIDAIAE